MIIADNKIKPPHWNHVAAIGEPLAPGEYGVASQTNEIPATMKVVIRTTSIKEAADAYAQELINRNKPDELKVYIFAGSDFP